MKKNIYTTFSEKIKGLNDESVYRFIASSDTIDRHGERIMIEAWDLENFKKNPIILFGHDSWSLENAIGKAIAITIDGNKLILDVVFSKANEKAQKVRAMIDEGVLNMMSVGFIPKKSEIIDGIPTITEAELLESSIVQLPANPQAEIIRTLGLSLNESGEVEFKNSTVTTEDQAEEIAPETKEEETVEDVTEDKKSEEEVVDDSKKEDTEEEEEEEETVEIEVEDDENDDQIEVEIEVEDEKSLSFTEMIDTIEEKSGRTLSEATLEKIASAKAFAEETQNSLAQLISALDTLAYGTGDKGLDDFVVLKRSDLLSLQEKMRTQDRTQENVLSFIKTLL